MTDCIIGLFAGFWLALLFDVLIINFIYLSNIDLFFDIIIFKKNKDRLINYFKQMFKE